jgi:hypothetical protein
MNTHYSLATAPAFVGRDLGVSDWVAVDQDASISLPHAPAIGSESTSISIAPRAKVLSAGRSRTAT